MLNNYHFSLGYFNWFIVFTCMNILVFCLMTFFLNLIIIESIFSGLCSLYIHMYVDISIYLISH